MKERLEGFNLIYCIDLRTGETISRYYEGKDFTIKQLLYFNRDLTRDPYITVFVNYCPTKADWRNGYYMDDLIKVKEGEMPNFCIEIKTK